MSSDRLRILDTHIEEHMEVTTRGLWDTWRGHCGGLKRDCGKWNRHKSDSRHLDLRSRKQIHYGLFMCLTLEKIKWCMVFDFSPTINDMYRNYWLMGCTSCFVFVAIDYRLNLMITTQQEEINLGSIYLMLSRKLKQLYIRRFFDQNVYQCNMFKGKLGINCR